MIVCALRTPGFVECNPSLPSSTYTGHDVKLFRMVASQAGWTELVGNSTINSTNPALGNDTAYQFKCIPDPSWGNTMAMLVSNGTYNECAIAIGMITVTKARMDMGVRYSFSYYHTGLSIMTYVLSTGPGLWSFLEPFQGDLWAAIVLTVTVLPLLVWYLEQNNSNTRRRWRCNPELLENLHSTWYDTLLSVFGLKPVPASSTPTRLVALYFTFLILVVICEYISAKFASTVVQNQSTSIRSVDDLRGKAVSTHSIYQDRIRSTYGLHTGDIEWTGAPAFLEARTQMMEGRLQAYVMSEVALKLNIAQYNYDCGLRLVGPVFLPFDYAFTFNIATEPNMIDAVNRGMVWAEEHQQLGMLQNEYLVIDDSCSTQGLSPFKAISFYAVAGLWIVLACAVSLALLLTMLVWFKKFCCTARHRGKPMEAEFAHLSCNMRTLTCEDNAHELTETTSNRSIEGNAIHILPSMVDRELQSNQKQFASHVEQPCS